MNDVFLGQEGITSTSANYYANMAKELVQADMKKLEDLKLYTTTLSSIANPSGYNYIVTKGSNNIDWISNTIKRISDMNTLIAYLREAIKYKEYLIQNIPFFDIWYKENYPDEVNKKAPQEPSVVYTYTENEALSKWDKNQRLLYLSLEAKAATFGKYIHPNGSISKAREDAHKIAVNPTEVSGTGRECLIYEKNLTVSIDTIDDYFMQLQSKYRKYEQNLNCLKAQLKEEVNAENERRTLEYSKAINDYNHDMDVLHNLKKERKSEYDNWVISQKEIISKLKVMIPEKLQSIYNTVVEASK